MVWGQSCLVLVLVLLIAVGSEVVCEMVPKDWDLIFWPTPGKDRKSGCTGSLPANEPCTPAREGKA